MASADGSTPIIRCNYCDSTDISALGKSDNEFACRSCKKVFDLRNTPPVSRRTPTLTCTNCKSPVMSLKSTCINNRNEMLCDSCVNNFFSEEDNTISHSLRSLQNSPQDALDAIKDQSNDIYEAIMKSLADPNFVSPEVIIFLGNPGVGKSEIINTIYETLTGHHLKRAKSGAGDSHAVTETVDWYMNCGVTLHNIEDPCKRERLNFLVEKYPHIKDKESLIERLPHLIDVVGFSDDSRHETLLELLIGGYIESETNVIELQEMDAGRLRLKFPTPYEELKATKICYVHSRGISDRLVTCLQNIMKKTDSITHHKKYTSAVYLIFSKWDLVWDPNNPNKFAVDVNVRPENSVTVQDAQKEREGLLSRFNMKNSDKSYSREWSSFMEEKGPRNVHIENNTLEFMKILVEQRRMHLKPPSPRRTAHLTRFKLFLYDIWQILKKMFGKLFLLLNITAVLVAIGAIIYFMMTQLSNDPKPLTKSDPQ